LEVPGNATTDVSLSSTVFNNSLYLFDKGIDDQRIYTNVLTGNTGSGWSQVPGDATTDVSLSSTVFNNNLYLFSKGIDDQRVYLNCNSN